MSSVQCDLSVRYLYEPRNANAFYCMPQPLLWRSIQQINSCRRLGSFEAVVRHADLDVEMWILSSTIKIIVNYLEQRLEKDWRTKEGEPLRAIFVFAQQTDARTGRSRACGPNIVKNIYIYIHLYYKVSYLPGQGAFNPMDKTSSDGIIYTVGITYTVTLPSALLATW